MASGPLFGPTPDAHPGGACGPALQAAKRHGPRATALGAPLLAVPRHVKSATHEFYKNEEISYINVELHIHTYVGTDGYM